MSQKNLNARRRAVLKCRLMGWLFPLGSLGVLLAAVALTTGAGAHQLLRLLGSPVVLLLLGLFSLIYLPAGVRLYYVCLLNAKGVFTAAERQAYQAGRQKWDKLLLRAGFLGGMIMVLLAAWKWAGR